jgi:RimJ/RimL family protein N-acetyltransferase
MKAAGSDFSNRLMQVISRTENGILMGGIVYENYTGANGSCLVHIAGFEPNWINRDLLWIMFDYPFRQLDCKHAFAQVAANNTKAYEFCMSIGWELLHTLEGVFPDGDMLLLRMKRENCRFLGIKPKNVRPRGMQDG